MRQLRVVDEEYVVDLTFEYYAVVLFIQHGESMRPTHRKGHVAFGYLLPCLHLYPLIFRKGKLFG